MKAIGGYNSLDSNFFNSYSCLLQNRHRFNSGRNALSVLLKKLNIKFLYLPYYTCDVVHDMVAQLGVEVEYYSLDLNLEIEKLGTFKDAYILYTNYFGVKDKYVELLSKSTKKLIVDNAQALYCDIDSVEHAVYSPRKFLGIPDGGMLKTSCSLLDDHFEKDHSSERISHLINRIDQGVEQAYAEYTENEKKIRELPVLHMSELTSFLIDACNHEEIIQRRKTNFDYLNKELLNFNSLRIDLEEASVPLVYPLYHKNGEALKKVLIQNKIFIPTFWPNLDEILKDKPEELFNQNIVAIPIDQRYNIEDMSHIVRIIKSVL